MAAVHTPTLPPTPTEAQPIVHAIPSQTTNTWQYVITDPITRHCIILDPVRDHCDDAAVVSTKAADSIIAFIAANNYTVDYILETHATGSAILSAAWYLRMQFSQSQGWPPQLCNEATVSSLQALWQRKYGTGNKFSTTIRPGLEDGEAVKLGELSITCIHLPGFAAPNRRAYLVGKEVFGAHSVATLRPQTPNGQDGNGDDKSAEAIAVDSKTYLDAWASVQRILSLPADTRVWHETSHAETMHGSEPYDLVSTCAATNGNAASGESDFNTARREESAWAKPPSQRRTGLKARLGNWLAA